MVVSYVVHLYSIVLLECVCTCCLYVCGPDTNTSNHCQSRVLRTIHRYSATLPDSGLMPDARLDHPSRVLVGLYLCAPLHQVAPPAPTRACSISRCPGRSSPSCGSCVSGCTLYRVLSVNTPDMSHHQCGEFGSFVWLWQFLVVFCSLLYGMGSIHI